MDNEFYKPYLNGKLYVTFFNNRTYRRFEKICQNSECFQFLDGIDGNEIRVKIIEKQKGFFTLSFRANRYANVCEVAKHFDGGGHIRAAGGKATGSYKELLNNLINVCKEELDKYPNEGKKGRKTK